MQEATPRERKMQRYGCVLRGNNGSRMLRRGEGRVAYRELQILSTATGPQAVEQDATNEQMAYRGAPRESYLLTHLCVLSRPVVCMYTRPAGISSPSSTVPANLHGLRAKSFIFCLLARWLFPYVIFGPLASGHAYGMDIPESMNQEKGRSRWR